MDFVEKRYAIGSGLMDSIEEQNLQPEAVEANE